MDLGQKTLRPFAQTRVTMSGTFESLTLYDLLINLTQAGKSSRLYTLIEDDEAEVLVFQGQVVSATYQHKIGEDALLSIFAVSDGRNDVEFLVQPFEEASYVPSMKNIHLPLEQLLMAVVMQLEQNRDKKQEA